MADSICQQGTNASLVGMVIAMAQRAGLVRRYMLLLFCSSSHELCIGMRCNCDISRRIELKEFLG